MNASKRTARLVSLLALICFAPMLMLRAEVPSANSFLEPDFAITTNKVDLGDTVYLASNGTNFLVAWAADRSGRVDYARVSAGGIVEQDYVAANYPGGNWFSVASDGKNYLLACTEFDTVRSTNLLKIAKISGSGALSHNVVTIDVHPFGPVVASDRTNWFIIFSNADTAHLDGIILDENLIPSRVFPISSSPGFSSQAAFNGSDYLCVWRRYDADGGIFASRISANGELLDTNHIVLSPAHSDYHSLRTVSDGTDFMVAWGSDRLVGDIRAARVTAAGELLDTNGVIVLPGPYRWSMDLCYSGRDYVINVPSTDITTYADFGAGLIFKEPGNHLAEFTHNGWSFRQGIASDRKGRILLAGATATGIRGRYLDTRPRLQQVTAGDQVTTLSWSTVKERTYQVEQNATLESSAWTAASSVVTATNSTLTLTLQTNTQPHSFYRVRQLP